MTKCILALDQGTTSSRAIAFNEHGLPVHLEQEALPLSYPHPGWVEQDPTQLWAGQLAVAERVMQRGDLELCAVGVANQRETTIIWDRSGKPIYPAIVWQDRRTASRCLELKQQSDPFAIREKTGLVIDPYFPATKIEWILDHVPGARKRAEAGELLFGTVDTFLAWQLSQGELHITDVSNASRSLLFDIRRQEWDQELLKLFNVPREILPQVVSSSGQLGTIRAPGPWQGKPLAALCGDQQAALFGQLCLSPGMSKSTYGTGCFVMVNTGSTPVFSERGLLSTIAWRIGQQTTYALEGSVFVAGAAVQWLAEGLGVIENSAEIEQLAGSVADSAGVVFVPALTGMAAPHWEPGARGTILGLTRGTTRAHLARATLEGIALQVSDIMATIEHEMKGAIAELRVDGGASANSLLMQIQADLLETTLIRPACQESTALGAAFLAGLAVGFWPNQSSLQQIWHHERSFTPSLANREYYQRLRNQWQKATRLAIQWSSDS